MGRRMVSFLRVIRLLLITFRFLTVCSVSFLFALEKYCFKYPLSLQAFSPSCSLSSGLLSLLQASPFFILLKSALSYSEPSLSLNPYSSIFFSHTSFGVSIQRLTCSVQCRYLAGCICHLRKHLVCYYRVNMGSCRYVVVSFSIHYDCFRATTFACHIKWLQ